MLVRFGFASSARRAINARRVLAIPTHHRFQHTTSEATQGWLEPVARYLVSVPETIGILDALPYPYTASIVVMTLLLRSSISVPISLWQRSRGERLNNIVVPEWNVWKKQIPASILSRQASNGAEADEMHRRQVQRQIQSALREKWKHLVQIHNCAPWRTTAVSLLAHVPLFVLVTVLLRQAAILPDSPLLQELIPWWSPDATFAAQTAATKQILVEKGLDARSIERLTTMGGPTLVDRDSTQIMPIVVGSLNMLNVELSQWVRQRRAAREQALGLGTKPAGGSKDNDNKESLREQVLGNALRTGAVVSIPIACSVPSVLLVYWSTSALVTMMQNVYFAWLDGKNK